MRISAHVRSALRTNFEASRPNPSFQAEALRGTGRVVLTGVANSKKFRREAEELANSCDGVSGVDNQPIIVDNRRFSMPSTKRPADGQGRAGKK